ncbi:hypothetical protein CANARDRAFT_173605 [[Candida] arabinofermentans NRRL YB-2248]|uniref:Uncharacterized protein n=1 Tax=[Candida] arabinofermentans NRRL YB-2248 TaxID=983967 RepID=A0A1E4T7E0_9ASCO|nr:hypothetical protein CANARDRAFT_173605 [[Candida] arabinofermentans NRRL YB-2248]
MFLVSFTVKNDIQLPFSNPGVSGVSDPKEFRTRGGLHHWGWDLGHSENLPGPLGLLMRENREDL